MTDYKHCTSKKLIDNKYSNLFGEVLTGAIFFLFLGALYFALLLISPA